MNTKRRRIVYHIFFWIFFLFVYPIWLRSGYSGDYRNNLFSNLAVLPGLIAGIYLLVYYIIPKCFVKNKKYLSFIALYFLLVYVLILHEIFVTRYIFLPIVDPELIEAYKTICFRPEYIFRIFIMIQTEIFIFVSVKYFKYYITSYFENERLKSKITETELNMLKSQIHPHFLFNTLNNIYTLSLETKNEKVSESIMKLSDILRYTLYGCNTKFILLEREIDLIEGYIELEKLRYSNLDLECEFPKNISNVYVPPLILFTFVENAFKHGTSKAIKGQWLKIKLSVKGKTLHFFVKNNKSHIDQRDHMNYSKGIGLKNARKRLNIYFGEKKYLLEIKDETDFFEIYLKCPILQYGY